MATPYLSEIKVISWNFAPKGWAFANGQLLPINQNQALFALLGTTYGGDGRVNFGLPNLQGRVPMHLGGGLVLGEQGGEAAHTVNTGELPAHIHSAQASTAATNTLVAQGHNLATPTGPMYAPSDANDVPLHPLAVAAAGGGQPHENMSPYLVLNFVIALQGIFPTQN